MNRDILNVIVIGIMLVLIYGSLIVTETIFKIIISHYKKYKND